MDTRLNKITITSAIGSTLLKTYVLNYNSEVKSRLTSVELTGTKNEKFNATTFEWGEIEFLNSPKAEYCNLDYVNAFNDDNEFNFLHVITSYSIHYTKLYESVGLGMV